MLGFCSLMNNYLWKNTPTSAKYLYLSIDIYIYLSICLSLSLYIYTHTHTHTHTYVHCQLLSHVSDSATPRTTDCQATLSAGLSQQETAKETQIYRTVFWTLWEREGGMIYIVLVSDINDWVIYILFQVIFHYKLYKILNIVPCFMGFPSSHKESACQCRDSIPG